MPCPRSRGVAELQPETGRRDGHGGGERPAGRPCRSGPVELGVARARPLRRDAVRGHRRARADTPSSRRTGRASPARDLLSWRRVGMTRCPGTADVRQHDVANDPVIHDETGAVQASAHAHAATETIRPCRGDRHGARRTADDVAGRRRVRPRLAVRASGRRRTAPIPTATASATRTTWTTTTTASSIATRAASTRTATACTTRRPPTLTVTARRTSSTSTPTTTACST